MAEGDAPPGQAYVVMAGGGGTGKSLVSVNLAVALRQLTGARVALIDSSLQFGDVSAMLGLDPEHSIVDVVTAQRCGDPEAVEAAMVDGPLGVRVLLAPPSPELADYITAPDVRVLMQTLRRMFDHIVIDAPGVLSDPGLEILERVDAMIVLTDLTPISIKNVRLMLSVADILRIGHQAVHVVANDHRGVDALHTVPDPSAELGLPVEISIPHEPDLVADSVDSCVPLVCSHPHSGVSLAVTSLAERLLAA